METTHRKTHPALYTLILVFFFWGFVAASNTVLIGLFRKNFELTQFQSQLVDMAFYSAYFLGSLIYFFISLYMGDPLNKIGHKKGLIIGLCISALGALGFIPAADLHSFSLMLGSLFVVGLGFALQQIVANPFVIAMGDPATGSHRVSLAGGINSFGTTIGPLLINYAIFGSISENTSNLGIENVKTPYLILCGAFLAFALILWLSKMPEVKNAEKMEGDFGVFKNPQIIWGMLAILVYVGTEVTIQSNLPSLMETKAFLGLSDKQTVHYISLYWGSLMIGRWTGAISVFQLSKSLKRMLMILIPIVAFFVIYGVNYIKFSSSNSEIEMDKLKDLMGYLPMVFVFIIANFLAMEKPVRTMIIFGAVAAILTGYGMIFSGQWALYALVSGGLFCSVMWPCIFSLSIAGLGKYTNQGSSLLVMMILGGAIIPPFQGILSDQFSIHFSYIVPVVGFVFLAFYGWKVGQILKNKGIDFDATTGNGH
jgi:FHS family L-fucose permease-like MFS transporter